jgi:hypothetical protein
MGYIPFIYNHTSSNGPMEPILGVVIIAIVVAVVGMMLWVTKVEFLDKP